MVVWFIGSVVRGTADCEVEEEVMNELERTALNEIMRTVTYIAEKVDDIDSKINHSEEVKDSASSAS